MIKRLAFLSSLFLILALWSQAAAAQNIREQFEKKLPVYESEFLPAEQFEETTQAYDVVPFDDEELHYKVRLPKDWTESKTEGLNTYTVSDKVLGEIARYYSPAELGLRSRFSIEVMQVKYEISALHWFMNHVITNAITLQGVKEYSDSRVEALYVLVIDDTSFVVRSVVQMTGDRIVLAQLFTPLKLWQEQRGVQNQIINSFDLTTPKAVNIEELKTMRFLDIARMQYPASWYIKQPNTRSVDEMSVRLVNLNEINVLNGKIDIDLISTYSDHSLEEQYETLKKEIEETGLEIQYLMDKAEGEFTFHPEMDYGFVDVYKAQNKIPYIINYELWIAVMGGEGYFYYVTLLTPSRDDEFFVWSRNVETMKIVVEHLGPDEILYR